jgi:hypothetical protein
MQAKANKEKRSSKGLRNGFSTIDCSATKSSTTALLWYEVDEKICQMQKVIFIFTTTAPTSGLENKGLEHSMDLALALEDQKTAIYASQNGYGYNSGLQVPHNIPPECKSQSQLF